jgi:hypothetical protein
LINCNTSVYGYRLVIRRKNLFNPYIQVNMDVVSEVSYITYLGGWINWRTRNVIGISWGVHTRWGKVTNSDTIQNPETGKSTQYLSESDGDVKNAAGKDNHYLL